MSDVVSMFKGMDVERVSERVTGVHPIFEKPFCSPDDLVKSGIIPLGRNAIYSAIKGGDIPHVRIGGKILIKTKALRKLLDL